MKKELRLDLFPLDVANTDGYGVFCRRRLSANYELSYDKCAKRLFEACGYGYDVLQVEMRKCTYAAAPERFRISNFSRYILFVYSKEMTRSHDADSYENVEMGHVEPIEDIRCQKMKWIYGHSGFEMLQWCGSSYVSSEYGIFADFIERGVFGGGAKYALPCLPCVGSAEELEIWLAAVGK